MYLRQRATSGSNIIVTYPRNVVSEYGYDPSLVRYLLSRALGLTLLTPVLAIFEGGLYFITAMWIVFLARHISNYYEMYPRSRKATKEEADWYRRKQEIEKKKELVSLKTNHDIDVMYHDEFGWIKSPEAEYSVDYCEKVKLYSDELPSYYIRQREDNLRKWSEIEEKLAEVEAEYGSTWFEDFRKDIDEYQSSLRIDPQRRNNSG